MADGIYSQPASGYIFKRGQIRCFSNTIGWLHLTGELSRLVELFNRNEVSALVTKGPVAAVQAYAHVGMLNLDLFSG